MSPIFKVDTFTDTPFAGNPAGVCLLDAPRDEEWMQSVAQEMNLPETAFLVAQDDGFQLRWFTPTVEVDLCGHATLASAHILWETGFVQGQVIRFFTCSGLLSAQRSEQRITLDFPATAAQAATSDSKTLRDALGVTPLYVGKSQFDYLVEIDSEAAVRNLAPDLMLIKSLPVRGVIVTSRATIPDVDFVSRFFAPAAGIDEDPVTGSAHCCLVPFWSERLNKNRFIAHQVSQRGGILHLELNGDRVLISGAAITILRGEILV
ncbi:MAG: PhzF family phenazine biosynthesis protein [Abitibacteriaceae bacterium]|nr:PhzF family phenazine biosynthesis protein [Abditibacteriaceae bacterium]